MTTKRSKYGSARYSDDFLDLQPADVRERLLKGEGLFGKGKPSKDERKNPAFRLKYLRLGPYIIRTNFADEQVEEGVNILLKDLMGLLIFALVCLALFACI